MSKNTQESRNQRKTSINNLLKIKNLIDNYRLKISQEQRKTIESSDRYLKAINQLLTIQQEKILLNSPKLKLKQGYSIIFNNKNQIIKNVDMVDLEKKVITTLYDGKISSVVKAVKKDKKIRYNKI